jgi:hypothetical protein
LSVSLAVNSKNMKKVFVIEKVEGDKRKYLFRVHHAAYWTESIAQATLFDSEKKAEDVLMEDVREQKKSFFKITSFFINK